MSGERWWLLPVIVVAVGGYFLYTGMQGGTLMVVTLKPVNWAGLAAMAAGLILAIGKQPVRKLLGVLACGVGAIMVICL